MTMCRGMRFPPLLPAEINHVVVTGTLSAEPQEALSPTGKRVTLLQIDFPVADPDDGRALWKWGSCLVEVPGGRSQADIEPLHGGASVLASGQLSDRWMVEGGHANRRGVVVASLLKSGSSSESA
jgi:hypothetical protein